jgi:adenine-specific DNA glycosylase
MQMIEQRPQETKILEAWEGVGYYGRRHTEAHRSALSI